MTKMSELMQELACAVRKRDFEAAESALSIISARFGYERAISRGRYAARSHPPTLLDEPNVVTVHDLPSRDGIKIVKDCGVNKWRPAA